ncbi:hypothetical protein AYL99_09333 [Fonsecaea erecta]|uniref:Metallo-beta-lactamase domain-containing protein n=1 Tax=Fonsecaea erecta TaxID=1367422 RepID=A0A178Z8P1_9EURO|nr:hypothetical protein AYL99_09333 [Fonsecaea erecta]OAP56154.1 hypothetical protein AYL99_09333 [Fonsecaea erecta]
MSQEAPAGFHVPAACPYTIEVIQTSGCTNSKTYLIREFDRYGEFPHIYAKICGSPSSSATLSSHSPGLGHSNVCWAPGSEGDRVIILSDTGCGTETPRHHSSAPPAQKSHGRAEPEVWNIRTFLEYTINPGGRIPYLIMTTHCHYDHIMGIGKLPPTSTAPRPRDLLTTESAARPPTTVLSSSYGKSFITPYANLQDHSLCDKLGLQAPRYDVGIWAQDMSRVVFTPPTTISSPSPCNTDPSLWPTLPTSIITTSLTILHTPGHTPDSLSWYDADLRLLCVGDSFYVKETSATHDAKWGPEPPMPVIFDLESDLGQWWRSLKKVLDFVRARNAEFEKGEGPEDERLSGVNAKGSDEAHAEAEAAAAEDDNDDEGFVYIDADEVARATWKNDVEGVSQERAESTLPSRPETERTVTAKQETARAPAQPQTGFDIPSPSKRGVIALPICPTPNGRPLGGDQGAADDDVWMVVVDPVARPRPHRNPDHHPPARLRLDPIITSHRFHSHLPTSSLKKKKKDGNPFLPAPRISSARPPSSCSPSIPQPCSRASTRPRVRLCAAHTTVSVDAERAILTMQRFMLRVLENGVPRRRASDGPRGEERWLWDDALSSSPPPSSRSSGRGSTAVRMMRHDAGVHMVRDLERAERRSGYSSSHEHDHDHDHGYGYGYGYGHRGERRPANLTNNGSAPPASSAAPAPSTDTFRNGNVDMDRDRDRASFSYSVLAPLSVIEEGRRSILGRPAGVV